ncbi:M28 family peptidase [Lutibacter sp. HS1-25]|uniref:M28 family metallopeptidase n=1 Tax=Lutibacter sp. HS1-25 TaxID=2485000 RepID=UPI00101206AA|nr:M28 family metallopeptidase [Lutibacter sp. HS1-25]RXP52337.1 M28 family peptidase [Lutibacter sp. HS1-25]
MKNILFIILFLPFIYCGKTANFSEITLPFIQNPALITGDLAFEYSKIITPKDLKTHLYVMASDEFEGRNTGEPGQKLAAEYLKDFYKSHNIASPLGGDDYFQEIPTEELRPNLKPSENVLAFIEGSEKPEEIIVISAHFDHLGKTEEDIFNGADDDGSGTVAIMKIAEAFQNAVLEGNGPKRSILFLHVTGEERGLLGSKYYVNHPVFPLKNTVADLNIDMIGRVDEAHTDTPEFVYLIGSDKLSSELHEISEAINNQFTKLVLDYTYNDDNDPNRFYYRSDHYNFAKNNIPIIFYFNGTHEDYHKASDTPDKINYEVLAKRTQLVFFTAWELANRDKRIVVDK